MMEVNFSILFKKTADSRHHFWRESSNMQGSAIAKVAPRNCTVEKIGRRVEIRKLSCRVAKEDIGQSCWRSADGGKDCKIEKVLIFFVLMWHMKRRRSDKKKRRAAKQGAFYVLMLSPLPVDLQVYQRSFKKRKEVRSDRYQDGWNEWSTSNMGREGNWWERARNGCVIGRETNREATE